MMVTKVQKWGNSQGLRLSKQVLDLAGIAVGEEVELMVVNHQILVQKVTRPKFNLAELVARIPADYTPEEVSFGKPEGKEEW